MLLLQKYLHIYLKQQYSFCEWEKYSNFFWAENIQQALLAENNSRFYKQTIFIHFQNKISSFFFLNESESFTWIKKHGNNLKILLIYRKMYTSNTWWRCVSASGRFMHRKISHRRLGSYISRRKSEYDQRESSV